MAGNASLNLARAPFVNERPLRRIAAATLVLGVALLLVDLLLFSRYLFSSADLRGQLREVRSEIGAERSAIREFEGRFQQLDLPALNARVEFLNTKIEERTFGWGLLFERLGQVLPPRVRIEQLTPKVERERREARSAKPRVELQVKGEAETGEGMLEMLDALFAHPAFEGPVLQSESRDDKTGGYRFQLSVFYLPHAEEGPQSAPGGTSVAGAVAPAVPFAPGAEAGGQLEGAAGPLDSGGSATPLGTPPEDSAYADSAADYPYPPDGYVEEPMEGTEEIEEEAAFPDESPGSPASLGGSRVPSTGTPAGGLRTDVRGSGVRGSGVRAPEPGTVPGRGRFVPAPAGRNASSPPGGR